LDTPPENIDPNLNLDRLGLDSATAVALLLSLEEWLEIELMPELVFRYPTISLLSRHLTAVLADREA
jgi:acyl carrier protein